jgi:hypothetical protein
MMTGRPLNVISTINHRFGLRLPSGFFLTGKLPLVTVLLLKRPLHGRFGSETDKNSTDESVRSGVTAM